MKNIALAAFAATTALVSTPASALTFTWSYVIGEGSFKGQTISGLITGLEEGDNNTFVGGPIKATVTSAPNARFYGDKPYIENGSDFGDINYVAFKVKDGAVTFADAYLSREYGLNVSEGIWFGGYGGYRPGAITVDTDNSSPFYDVNYKGKTLFNLVPDAPAGTVPEPASWAMMIAGFGLVGGMSRRRRLRVVTA